MWELSARITQHPLTLAMILLLSVLFLSESLVYGIDIRRMYGVCPWMTHDNSNCSFTTLPCSNGRCINRSQLCNGKNDCGDNSDEKSCNVYPSDCPSSWKLCPGVSYGRCIPAIWFCDGVSDCPKGVDEHSCSQKFNEKFGYTSSTLLKGLQWLNQQSKKDSATEVWGPLVDKSAVALYFADSSFSTASNTARKQIAYEVSIKLLSKIFRKKLQNVPSTDLASFVNAFLVSCLDPRKFHGLDLIQELRNRADDESYTNPYVYLALCNAGETIRESDKKKLIDNFWSKRRTFWTDIQALTVLALACASQQPGSGVDAEILRNLTMELKKHQSMNGSVETLQTTALVMQALLAAEPEDDPDNFDEIKAVRQICQSQKSDGSFRNLMNTYFVLPVLRCRSLVNISSDHCLTVSGDEMSALEDLANRSGPKIRVLYSLWIGNSRDLERNLVLRVPANTSFYGIMEIAAEIDSKFRFEYAVKNRMPYINAISDLQDNPEDGKFWFLYSMKDANHTLIESSPAEVTPKNNDRFIMWYRSGSWVELKSTISGIKSNRERAEA